MRAIFGAIAILAGIGAIAHAEDVPDGKCYEDVNPNTKPEDFMKGLQGCDGKVIGINFDTSDTAIDYVQLIAMKVCDYHATILVTHNPLMKSTMLSCIKR
jgi:hypothetical protein